MPSRLAPLLKQIAGVIERGSEWADERVGL